MNSQTRAPPPGHCHAPALGRDSKVKIQRAQAEMGCRVSKTRHEIRNTGLWHGSVGGNKCGWGICVMEPQRAMAPSTRSKIADPQQCRLKPSPLAP